MGGKGVKKRTSGREGKTGTKKLLTGGHQLCFCFLKCQLTIVYSSLTTPIPKPIKICLEWILSADHQGRHYSLGGTTVNTTMSG